jgi:ribosomal protein S6--L-glutamate ligase
MKRTPKPGDFRANISQQGTGTVHLATKQELELSQRAASVVGCAFAGVDLMYDRDGQIKVIEVNAIPGWRGLEKVCGIDVASRLFGWLEGTSRPK